LPPGGTAECVGGLHEVAGDVVARGRHRGVRGGVGADEAWSLCRSAICRLGIVIAGAPAGFGGNERPYPSPRGRSSRIMPVLFCPPQKSVWLPDAARHRIRAVSCDGELTRASIHPQILLRRLIFRLPFATARAASPTTVPFAASTLLMRLKRSIALQRAHRTTLARGGRCRVEPFKRRCGRSPDKPARCRRAHLPGSSPSRHLLVSGSPHCSSSASRPAGTSQSPTP
jgi:hypothetical protein